MTLSGGSGAGETAAEIRPRSQRHLWVRGGTLVTMDPRRRVIEGDLLATDGRIAAVDAHVEPPPAARLLDARGLCILPGFIQGHVHLGQSLFRGLAEDRELLTWLRDRIWPLEAAHTEESAYRSGLLGAADAMLSGTTTVQDIGLVRGMEGIFRALDDSGLRAIAGKCLMDAGEVPRALVEETRASLDEAVDFIRRWQGAGRGRIRGALCPRFVLSSTRALWEGTVEAARKHKAPVHTHLLESALEEEAVIGQWGKGQMELLDSMGVLDADLSIAHGVLFGKRHHEILRGRRLGIVHCPSANAKLGSGIADLPYLRSLPNVHVGIGCDGPPCNNDLDILEEVRLAVLLQRVRREGGGLDGQGALEMATIAGAKAIGMETEIGSLEVGKAADLVALDLERPQTFDPGGASLADRIVYGAARDAVRWVVVDGEVVLENGRFLHFELEEIMRRAHEEARALVARAELP